MLIEQTFKHAIETMYQDEEFIVINKPAGISFHFEQDNPNSGIVTLCEQQFGIAKLWPVHRLDKMTSGLLILAKNADVAEEFNAKFRQSLIDKYYLAIANKKPKKKMGWVKGDLAPARRGSFKLLKSMDNPSITQFISQTVEMDDIDSAAPSYRLFLLKPHTGKTHQLRVVMKSLGSPICGDTRYQENEQAKQFDRGYLHAYGLNFKWRENTIRLVCPPLQGQLFQCESVQEQISEWSEPWRCFK